MTTAVALRRAAVMRKLGRARLKVAASALAVFATCSGETPTGPAPAPTPPGPAPPAQPQPAPPPPAPAGLHVSATTPDSITWRWTAVEGATAYEVQLSADELFDETDPIVNTTDTSYTATGLSAESRRHLRVRAVAGTVEAPVPGVWSSHVPGTSATPPPPAPADLHVSATTPDSITWTWAAVEGATAYEVQLSADELFDETDPIVNTTDTSYTATGLSAESRRHLRVRAVAGTVEAPVPGVWSSHVPGLSAPPPNRAPTTSGQIPAQTIPAETLAQGESVRVDVAEYFSDPDGDPLTYETTSSDVEVATVSVSESVVSLTALRPGSAEITVSVRDPAGETATLSFTVTIEGFTVSGTVSDGRKRAPVLSGVPVWVGDSREEATPTGADGEYRLPNLWGTVSVSVAANGYVPRTVEIEVEADHMLDLVLEHTGEPPYAGTVFITPRMIEPSDPTSLRSVTYVGRADRSVFDRRVGSHETVNVFLFEAEFGDRVVDIEVNPEFGTREAARAEVDRYAAPLGRLPAVLLAKLRDFEIHGGDGLAGGNSQIRHILIHTEEGELLLRGGFLEEVLMHEGVHATLEDAHKDTPGWLEARRDDGAFISEYARDFPQREDFAESFGPWFALRYLPDRLTAEERWAIATTMPNRLAYFDEQGFDMSPYTVRGFVVRHPGTSTFPP